MPMKVPLVYHERPIFGFDLGTSTAKMVQLHPAGHGWRVVGYGYANFPASAIVEGIIVDPEEIATALAPLLHQMTNGHITADRVAVGLPASRIYTRVLELPQMNATDLDAAVRLEAEQYIPVPLPDLYIDFDIVESQKEHQEVLMVAAPRAIVDSYMKLFELMKLEVSAIESSLTAVTRALVSTLPAGKPTLVADIGAGSIDLTVHDKVIRLTDTIAIGGDSLTKQMVDDLAITWEQAAEIKLKFGLGESGLHSKIEAALAKPLGTIVSEMKRVMKYYQDRSTDKRGVEAIILSGGSASMPGFVDYLSKALAIPVSVAEPWQGLDIKHLTAAGSSEAPMYATAIGLAELEGKL